VRAHGGEVAVASSKETGTTFTVRLPRHARCDNRAFGHGDNTSPVH
jgi:sensor histidine kinase regulating citrate/malate metabolism